MKRGAIELSTNFLVIMIISLVIFGSSLALTKKFFGKASDIKQLYDEKTESEIERLLDDGSRVAIPFDKKRIPNGEFATFGIGILNALNIGVENNFRLRIRFKSAFDKNNQQICTNPASCAPNAWLRTADGIPDSDGIYIDKSIKNNQQQKVILGVEVKNAPAGTYIFDIKVCYNVPSGTIPPPSDCTESGYPFAYDSLKKVYVEVPG
ncbi:hypothetical protein HYU13_04840 [Candidatus Woesearchaeota archaeon]|nr:hypothetical protein [Candidatus Woesearchaeota archaeon]